MLGYLVFAIGKNQDNEKFWLEFERNTDYIDAGIGRSKFIFGNDKYKKFIGTQCIYAVKILDDSAFSKHKCKLKQKNKFTLLIFYITHLIPYKPLY